MRRRFVGCVCCSVVVCACAGDPEPTADVVPRLTLSSPEVFAIPGSHVAVGAEVQGLGPKATITWTSLAPTAVVVESVSDAGRRAVLRFDGREIGNVVVTARGTEVLVDTLVVAILAERGP